MTKSLAFFDEGEFNELTIDLLQKAKIKPETINLDFNYHVFTDSGAIVTGSTNIDSLGVGTIKLTTDNFYKELPMLSVSDTEYMYLLKRSTLPHEIGHGALNVRFGKGFMDSYTVAKKAGFEEFLVDLWKYKADPESIKAARMELDKEIETWSIGRIMEQGLDSYAVRRANAIKIGRENIVEEWDNILSARLKDAGKNPEPVLIEVRALTQKMITTGDSIIEDETISIGSQRLDSLLGKLSLGASVVAGLVSLPSAYAQEDKVCTESWSCNDWSECKQNGKKTRSCSDVNNCGTVKDKPDESRSCTYIPSKCMESWACGDWNECSPGGTQTRSCSDSNKCGTVENRPLEIQSCTYISPQPPPQTPPSQPQQCSANWICGGWTECSAEGKQTRSCSDSNKCGTTDNRPTDVQSCNYVPQRTESWECNEWSACNNKKQIRTCTDSNKCGTSINKPVESQACCSPNWTCDGWTECSVAGSQTRPCKDTNDCGVSTGKPEESKKCTACTGTWSCSDWSSCNNDVQTRTCNVAIHCAIMPEMPATSQTCTMPVTPGIIPVPIPVEIKDFAGELVSFTTLNKAAARRGQPAEVEIRFNVLNKGTVLQYVDYVIQIDEEAGSIASGAVSSPPGQSAAIAAKFTTTKKVLRLKIILDPNNLIQETNEYNNEIVLDMVAG